MNQGIALFAMWGIMVLLASGTAQIGIWASKDDYPTCQEAPLNATNRCATIVNVARSIGTSLVFGGIFVAPASIGLFMADQSARGIKGADE